MQQRWSITRLATADHCLSQYEAKYEVPDPLPDTYVRSRDSGRAIHSIVERYKIELQANGLEQDLGVMADCIEWVFSNDPEIKSTECYDDVASLARRFARNYHHNVQKYIGAEFLLEKELPETDAIIEGYPDHVETMQDANGPIVVSDDLKSGFSVSVTSDHRFQGQVLSWIMLDYFAGQRVGWRINFARMEPSEIEEFPPNYSQQLEARLRSIIARVQNAKAKGAFPATPGSWCKTCPIAIQCRERHVLAARGLLVSDPNHAHAAAHDLLILDAAAEQRVDQLKAWTREEGPVTIADRFVGYRTTISGLRIADVTALITHLGLLVAKRDQYVNGDDDEKLKGEAGMMLLSALGTREALRMGLLRVNGDKTKLKGTQADERLKGLWVDGDTTTKFGVYSHDS